MPICGLMLKFGGQQFCGDGNAVGASAVSWFPLGRQSADVKHVSAVPAIGIKFAATGVPKVAFHNSCGGCGEEVE